jgi:hypothetical protein
MSDSAQSFDASLHVCSHSKLRQQTYSSPRFRSIRHMERAEPHVTFQRPLRLRNEAGDIWMPQEKMVDGKSFIGFSLAECGCYKFCTGHSQKWVKRDKNNTFGVPWFFQEMQAAQVAASKQKWEDFNKALHVEQSSNEERCNRAKRHRCRAAKPGDEEVCGQVVDLTLNHGGLVLTTKCLFGVRKQDRTFIEGTQENVKFVMRAIRSDYDNGRMCGRKWRARGPEDDNGVDDDIDDVSEEPDHEESPVGNHVVAS